MALALVRDLREQRVPASAEELACFETDVLDRVRAGARLGGAGRQHDPQRQWNLRLAAANRGIWKSSELQRRLAERGMVISAGKMSGLWSGQPNTVRLDELDVICAVLGCGVEELLLPEPETVPQPEAAGGEQPRAVAEARPVAPRPRGGRSLPPR